MGAEDEQQQSNGPNTIPIPNAKPNLITESQFLSWKRQKDADSSAKKADLARRRAEDIAAGSVQMNGRELFLHEPWVFDNDRF